MLNKILVFDYVFELLIRFIVKRFLRNLFVLFGRCVYFLFYLNLEDMIIVVYLYCVSFVFRLVIGGLLMVISLGMLCNCFIWDEIYLV